MRIDTPITVEDLEEAREQIDTLNAEELMKISTQIFEPGFILVIDEVGRSLGIRRGYSATIFSLVMMSIALRIEKKSRWERIVDSNLFWFTLGGVLALAVFALFVVQGGS